MTWTREQAGTAGVGLLRQLREAVTPFIEASGRTDTPALVRVLAGGNVFMDITWPDGKTYRGVGTGHVGEAIARAVGDLAVAGLEQLPADVRAKLVPLISQGALIVEHDPLLGSAAGSVEVPGHPPVALFTLHGGDVH